MVNVTPAKNKQVSIQLCHSNSLLVQQSEEGASGVALSPASTQAQVKTQNRLGGVVTLMFHSMHL